MDEEPAAARSDKCNRTKSRGLVLTKEIVLADLDSLLG